MNTNQNSNANNHEKAPLELMRHDTDNDSFIESFCAFCKQQRERAVSMINERGTTFSSLYMLLPNIEKMGLLNQLNQKHTHAIALCQRMSSRTIVHDNMFSPDNKMTQAVLRWILETGYKDDGLSDEFDNILDCCASILAVTYKDRSVLNPVIEMIFERSKKGNLIHDLVWTYFNMQDSFALKLIAEKMKSNDPNDIKLAHRLLNYSVPDTNEFEDERKEDPAIHYDNYMSWLNDNLPYIKFTGESFQQTSCPQVCRVNLDAKYLGKSLPTSSSSIRLTPSDEERLNAFHKMTENEQEKLANFANKVNTQDKRLWNKLMSYPVTAQLDISKSGLGGVRWL